MKKMISGWEHLKGVHCGSAAIRDVCGLYGHDFSEQMCFGLGGGLGFYYIKDRNTDPGRLIHLRGPMMEVCFLRNFGIDVRDWKYEDDADRALGELRRFVARDVPVLVQTDIRYLDYYDSSTHFPGHVVAVCGYDDSERVFYVADNSFEDIQAVSYESMKSSRSSKAEPYPLSNNWLEADLSGKEFDLERSAVSAVRRNAEMMLGGYVTLRGASGVETMKRWARELAGWKDASDWKWSARFAYQVICRRGVDGAGFRWFYRDFLDEISPLVPAVPRLGLAERMDEMGSRWSEMGLLLREISESSSCGSGFRRASDLAFEICELEKRYFSDVVENVAGPGDGRGRSAGA